VLTDTDINYQYPKKVIWIISHHAEILENHKFSDMMSEDSN
jgi:hypothetical protein